MIDADKLHGAAIPEGTFGWIERDAILYALSVGTTDLTPRNLARVYERNLQVLPTFGALGGMIDVDQFCALPGAGFDFARMLHAQHEIELHQPIPPRATDVVRTGKVVGVHDKGRSAMVVVDTDTTLDGAPLVTTRTTCFITGEGGFGASVGETPRPVADIPDRAPDASVSVATTATQAALYRLSGDWNILHIDPESAASVGFDRPILHGMCSFGIAVTAVIDALLEGKAEEVCRVSTRFTGVAYPGDVLLTRAWSGDGGAVFETVAANRDNAPILSGGSVLTTSTKES